MCYKKITKELFKRTMAMVYTEYCKEHKCFEEQQQQQKRRFLNFLNLTLSNDQNAHEFDVVKRPKTPFLGVRVITLIILLTPSFFNQL